MVKKVVDILVTFRTQMKNFRGVMSATTTQFRALGNEAGRLDKTHLKQMNTMGRFGAKLRFLTHGFRGFKMEMLGVMFFGMMIQRMFTGLLKPALEMSGAMQLLTTVLGLMFLPVGLAVLDLIMWLWEKWQGLTEKQKGWIRTAIVVGAVLGTFIFLFGSFVLGIGSMIIAFGGLLGPIGAVALALLGYFLWEEHNDAIAESLKGLLIGLDSLWAKFLDLGVVRKFFNALGLTDEQIEELKNPIKAIKGAWETFKTWITEKLEKSKTWQNIKKKWDELKDAAEEFKDKWVDDYWPSIKTTLEAFETLAKGINAIMKGWAYLTGKAEDIRESKPQKSIRSWETENLPDWFTGGPTTIDRGNTNSSVTLNITGGSFFGTTPEDLAANVSSIIKDEYDRENRTTPATG